MRSGGEGDGEGGGDGGGDGEDELITIVMATKRRHLAAGSLCRVSCVGLASFTNLIPWKASWRDKP